MWYEIIKWVTIEKMIYWNSNCYSWFIATSRKPINIKTRDDLFHSLKMIFAQHIARGIISGSLTHFSPMPQFYTPWKRQKTIRQSLFFYKVAVRLRLSILLKKRLRHSSFPVNVVKISIIPFIQNTSKQLLL